MAHALDDPFGHPSRPHRVPPHSLEAERAVIGGVLLDNDALAAALQIVGPADFYASGNRIVFEAFAELARMGRAIDLVTLRGYLVDRGTLRKAGGDEHLLSLTETIPAIANIAHHAAIVRDKAVVRRLIQRCHEIAARGYGDHGPLSEYLDSADEQIHELVELDRKVRQGVAGRSAVTRALELGAHSGVPLPSGFESIDGATRGGLRAGRTVVIAGPPGAGKTSLAVQLGRHYARLGHAVGVYASDEDADGLMIRWGQQEGLTREQLEQGHPSAREYLASTLRPLRLLFVDADEAEAVLEDVVQQTAALAQGTGLPGVLIVDSLQTARCRAHEVAKTSTAREKIEIVVRVIKHAARGVGLLVIALSEVNRGLYRGGADPKINPLAAGKDSSAIEYACALLLVLQSVAGESDLVDVQIPKNRLGGGKDPFRIKLDRDRAQFHEVELVDEEAGKEAEAEAREAARDGRVEKLAELMFAALLSANAKGAKITARKDLLPLVRGQQSLKSAALSLLLASGRIHGGKGRPYGPPTQEPPDTPPPPSQDETARARTLADAARVAAVLVARPGLGARELLAACDALAQLTRRRADAALALLGPALVRIGGSGRSGRVHYLDARWLPAGVLPLVPDPERAAVEAARPPPADEPSA